MESLVFSIQKFSVHDGPGIRTTIFLKGCPLNCIWCHNPESQKNKAEVLYDKTKCTFCGRCERACPNKVIKTYRDRLAQRFSSCFGCGRCVDECYNNCREIAGKSYTVKEIMKEVVKDLPFYDESGGGVTLSGGEAMVHIDFCTEIAKECKRLGIHVVMDTCGYAPFENFEKIMDYVDLFLYDIKIMDSKEHAKYTGKPNSLIIENLKKLSERNAKINLRIPLIENINTSDENIDSIIELCKEINIESVNLLPYHDIGRGKYEKLGMPYSEGVEMKKPDDAFMEATKNKFSKYCGNVKIGG